MNGIMLRLKYSTEVSRKELRATALAGLAAVATGSIQEGIESWYAVEHFGPVFLQKYPGRN